MAEPPDFEDLARRYLDLWQDQWAAAASDPHAAEAMARLYGMVGQHMAAAAPLAQAMLAAVPFMPAPFTTPFGSADGQPHGDDPSKQDSHDRAASAPSRPDAAGAAPGAASAGAAPDSGTVAVADIARRLAVIEERLARLEARRSAGRAAGGGRKPRR
ncbi:MAG: hypothetical protein V3R98_08325 [Alphaproteobacteria bacterium]